MPSHLEYDPRMRYWMPVFAVLLAASFSLCASAQANGVPPSVTSFGFAGPFRNAVFHTTRNSISPACIITIIKARDMHTPIAFLTTFPMTQ